MWTVVEVAPDEVIVSFPNSDDEDFVTAKMALPRVPRGHSITCSCVTTHISRRGACSDVIVFGTSDGRIWWSNFTSAEFRDIVISDGVSKDAHQVVTVRPGPAGTVFVVTKKPKKRGTSPIYAIFVVELSEAHSRSRTAFHLDMPPQLKIQDVAWLGNTDMAVLTARQVVPFKNTVTVWNWSGGVFGDAAFEYTGVDAPSQLASRVFLTSAANTSIVAMITSGNVVFLRYSNDRTLVLVHTVDVDANSVAIDITESEVVAYISGHGALHKCLLPQFDASLFTQGSLRSF